MTTLGQLTLLTIWVRVIQTNATIWLKQFGQTKFYSGFWVTEKPKGIRMIAKQFLAFYCLSLKLTSHINAQFHEYVSFRSGPNAFTIDVFTLIWSELKFYDFPPFSLIAAVLSKIQSEGGLCYWFGQLKVGKPRRFKCMMRKPPVRLKASPDLLRLPSHPKEQHPIWTKINLLVWLLSGRA